MALASPLVVSLTCPRRRPLIAKERGTTLFRTDYFAKSPLWSWRWLRLGESPSIQFHGLGVLGQLARKPVTGSRGTDLVDGSPKNVEGETIHFWVLLLVDLAVKVSVVQSVIMKAT